MKDEASVRREASARMRAAAFQMRREGAPFDSIGARLGVNRGAARKLVQKEVRLLAGESDTEERRLLHAEALMDLWRVLYGPATAGASTPSTASCASRSGSRASPPRPPHRRRGQRRGEDRARPRRGRARPGGAQAPLQQDARGRAAGGLTGGRDPRPPAAQEALRVTLAVGAAIDGDAERAANGEERGGWPPAWPGRSGASRSCTAW